MFLISILILSGFLIWYDWNRIKRWRRIPLLFLLFISLILALTNPKLGYFGSHKKIALITDSVSKNVELELKNADSVVVWHAANSISTYQKIYDISEIGFRNFDSLLIYGAGINEEELAKFPNIPTRRIAPIPAGISQIKTEKLLHEGNPWQVEIFLENPDNIDFELHLLKKGRVVEKRISKEENQKETFVLFPEIGINEYEIELIRNNKSSKIPIGVQVIPSQKLNYVVLERSVGFETKFIVNQLAKQGNSIWWRRQTSKNVFHSQQINTGNHKPFTFSKKLLNQKDVLISDWQALNELSKIEFSWVKDFVENGGNLLLSESIRSEYLPIAKKLGLEIFQFEQETVLGMEVIPQWEFKRDTLANFLTIWDTSFSLEDTKPVMFTSNGKALVWKTELKKGKVVFHSFEQTYPWQIQGKEAFYNEFWKHLHKQLQLENDFPIQFSQNLVGENTRTKIKAEQDFEVNNLIKIPKGNTSVLFDSSGWKQFHSEIENSLFALLIQSESDLKTVDYSKRYQATTRYLTQLNPKSSNSLALKWPIFLGFAFVFWIALLLENRI